MCPAMVAVIKHIVQLATSATVAIDYNVEWAPVLTSVSIFQPSFVGASSGNIDSQRDVTTRGRFVRVLISVSDPIVLCDKLALLGVVVPSKSVSRWKVFFALSCAI